VKNRPGWQALEERLAGSDVVALVAYDLARLHRKGWRIGKLLEVLEENRVRLILSDPERTVDTSTAMGKIFIQFMAMADEYYAEDLAIRARGSIRGRKAKGITVSLPPFGTMRNNLGYLVPRIDGVWLLENGKLVEGRSAK
jgi:DNA invertase Pin-like site-specific DNA recombinase